MGEPHLLGEANTKMDHRILILYHNIIFFALQVVLGQELTDTVMGWQQHLRCKKKPHISFSLKLSLFDVVFGRAG